MKEDVEDVDAVLEEISIDDLEETAFLPGSNNVRKWGQNRGVCINSISPKVERIRQIYGDYKVRFLF